MTDTALRITVDEARSDADSRAIEALAGELAWCLGRFVDATADELTLQRSQKALLAWRAMRESP